MSHQPRLVVDKEPYPRLKAVDRKVIAPVLLGLLVVTVLLPNAPLFREMPDRDPGTFLYIGDQVLHGKIPYRDVWDHKPPLIFYINALGLLLGGGSLWGIWLLELASLYAAALLGFTLMQQAFDTVPAIFGSVTWITAIRLVMAGGNYTEEFALPFQFAALYLFWRSEREMRYGWRAFLISVTAAVSFLLKPTLIGVQLSIVIFLLLKGTSSQGSEVRSEATRSSVVRRRWSVVAIFLGAFCVIALVAAYFAANDALGNLFDTVIRYNLVYSTTTFTDKVSSVLDGILMTSAIAVISLLSWAIGLYSVLSGKLENTNSALSTQRSLLLLALIALLVEFFLAAISGRSFSHYFLAWLPTFAVLMSFFAYALTRSSTNRQPATVGLFALLLVITFLPARELASQIALEKGRSNPRYQAADYVSRSTAKGDYVLVWGGDPGINFVAQRPSPSRFIYQYPLYRRGYQSAEQIDEFLQALRVNRPTLIIDTSPTSEFVPPIDPARREEWVAAIERQEEAGTATIDTPKLLPEMNDVFDYITSNYELTGRVAENLWPVYTYTGEH